MSYKDLFIAIRAKQDALLRSLQINSTDATEQTAVTRLGERDPKTGTYGAIDLEGNASIGHRQFNAALPLGSVVQGVPTESGSVLLREKSVERDRTSKKTVEECSVVSLFHVVEGESRVFYVQPYKGQAVRVAAIPLELPGCPAPPPPDPPPPPFPPPDKLICCRHLYSVIFHVVDSDGVAGQNSISVFADYPEQIQLSVESSGLVVVGGGGVFGSYTILGFVRTWRLTYFFPQSVSPGAPLNTLFYQVCKETQLLNRIVNVGSSIQGVEAYYNYQTENEFADPQFVADFEPSVAISSIVLQTSNPFCRSLPPPDPEPEPDPEPPPGPRANGYEAWVSAFGSKKAIITIKDSPACETNLKRVQSFELKGGKITSVAAPSSDDWRSSLAVPGEPEPVDDPCLMGLRENKFVTIAKETKLFKLFSQGEEITDFSILKSQSIAAQIQISRLSQSENTCVIASGKRRKVRIPKIDMGGTIVSVAPWAD